MELTPPPKSGTGSSRLAWLKYAAAAGFDVDPDAPRADIITMVEEGPPRGPQRRALEEQIDAMATGREHRAHVEACRELADVIDQVAAMGAFNDKAWREYRLALKELREAVGDGDTGDPIGEWIDSSRGSLRDTEDTRT